MNNLGHKKVRIWLRTLAHCDRLNAQSAQLFSHDFLSQIDISFGLIAKCAKCACEMESRPPEQVLAETR